MDNRNDRKRTSPGLATVAQLSGVSMMTVSRVLRGTGRVSDATRARVVEAVQQTGYVPNLAARSLVSNESMVAAAVVPSISNSMFAETLHGLSDVLRKAGYFLVVAHCGYSPREEFEVVKALIGQRPLGMFLHNTRHLDETADLLRKQNVPVFETGDLTDQPIDSVVSYSNRAAGRAMTEHLLQRGYRRIAFASAFRRNNDRVRERRIGYHEALRAAGLEPDRSLEFEGNPDPLTGARLLHQILDTCPEVDAIFFAGERLAIGAFFEAQSKGIQVPGRVAIAGFDFYEMNSQVYPSGITTIATPRRLIGTRAATLLLERTRNPSLGPTTTDLGFELAERGST
jgi:LacI family transcriptional regulator, gluconate utilization system Gnt-I transcriptional repressor